MTVVSQRCAAADHNARTFGAKADGVALDTDAIQRAVDRAHAEGGGVVHLPAGIYLSGTIELYSGVTLDLDLEAVLLGSPRLADYRRGNWPALLLARNQQDIAVTGHGVIDGNSSALVRSFEQIRASGNGLAFVPTLPENQILEFIGPTGVVTRLDAHALQRQGLLLPQLYGPHTRPFEYVRPQIIEFWQCRGVAVIDVTLRNAANWVQTYRDCEDVRIQRVTVRSTQYWNNDGIDLVDCKRVLVADCDIDSADDAICLKSDPLGNGCEDIVVERCRLSSRASAIKFGTASHHGFRRVRISDVSIRDTYRSAVAIQSVDGGAVEDIVIERIQAKNTGNAIFIRLGHRTPTKSPGVVRRIVLRDIQVQVPRQKADYHSEAGRPHNLIPSSVVGLPGHEIEAVVLENVHVHMGGGGTRDHAEIPLERIEAVPEAAKDYPEFSMFAELPAWGLFLRHTRGLTLRNVRFTLETPDFRPAIVADGSPDLTIVGLDVGPGGGQPVVYTRKSPGLSLNGARLPDGAQALGTSDDR